MTDDPLRYDLMVEEALRSVVKTALKQAADRGMPGEHHFYITFKTGHAGVAIPKRLSERYPDEMTIVLQHQFWDLEVDDQGFSVGLSFDGKTDTLRIAFDSVVAFADPSVKFGLQFGQDGELEGVDDSGMQGDEEDDDADDAAHPLPAPAAQQDAEPSSTGAEDDAPEHGDEKVVALDRFRKKPADR